jgi:hypothetical protein
LCYSLPLPRLSYAAGVVTTISIVAAEGHADALNDIAVGLVQACGDVSDQMCAAAVGLLTLNQVDT